MAKGYGKMGGGHMGGMGNMQGMLQRVQKMQADMQKMQQELQNRQYTGKAGGGAVEAVVTGEHKLVALTIAREAVDPEEVELLQDMILTAVNDAMRQAEEDASASMGRVTSGLDLSKFGL